MGLFNTLSNAVNSKTMYDCVMCTVGHRRRINTEEKAKVVAAV